MIHPHPIGHLLLLMYSFSFTFFIFLQEFVNRQQITIPEKYLIFTALLFALFGGAASYVLQLQHKLKEKFEWKELAQNMVLSGFVGLLIALLCSGWLSDTQWLAAVLIASFFKYLFLALIPKILTQKIHQTLSLKDDDSADERTSSKSPNKKKTEIK